MYNKEWTQLNKDKTRINRKRSKIKKKLIKYKVIPSSGPYTEQHQEVLKMLKLNMYEPLHNLYITAKDNTLIENQLARNQNKKIYKKSSAIDYKIHRRLKYLFDTGILPEDISNLSSDMHKEIYNMAINESSKITPTEIVNKYIDYANVKTKQKFMYRQILKKKCDLRHKKQGIIIDIKPEDIEINDYCPYLETKLSYASDNNKFSAHSVSVDRLDNSKGYIKGNIMVVSRLANTMKNNSTIYELKTFCTNVLRMHIEKINQ
jgi:hypothetical protein